MNPNPNFTFPFPTSKQVLPICRQCDRHSHSNKRQILISYIQLHYIMWNTPFLPAPFSFFFYQQFIPQPQHSTQDLNPSTLQICKDSPTREAVIDNSYPVAQFPPTKIEERVRTKAEDRRRCQRREKLKKRRERQDNFQRKQQKKDRNLPSNILKNFLHLLIEEQQFNKFMLIFSRLGITISFPIFIQKLKSSVNLSKNYIRPALVRSLCHQGSLLTAQESLFFRMSLKYFLERHFPLIAICTMKMKRRQRLDYLKVCRILAPLYSERLDAPSS